MDSTKRTSGEPFASGSQSGPQQDLRAYLIKKWAGLKLGDYALQLEKDGRRQRLLERLVKKTQDGTLGTSTGEEAPEGEMAVTVGDTYHQHLPPQAPPAKAGLGKALALAAALLCSAGLGSLGPILGMMLSKGPSEPSPPPSAAGEDTNTRYGLRLYGGD